MAHIQPPDRSMRTFVMLCIALIGLAVGYIAWTGRGTSIPAPGTDAEQGRVPTPAPVEPQATQELAAKPDQANALTLPQETTVAPAKAESRAQVLFRDTSLGATHGRLIREFLGPGAKRRQTSDVSCERAHFAAGRGVCLTAARGFVTVYDAFTFDADLTPKHRFALAGVPSRVRVSPDGRRAGITVFISGDSYAPGSFSTRTIIIDTESAESFGDLEQYTVLRDGKIFKAIDFNFWGVTFATRDRFYATLGTGGHTYLIEGEVATKQAVVLHDNVECPSLSPDGSRIAFKKRMPGSRLQWRLHVLDLRTGMETALAETRSVDDQAEWLDSATVIYALPSDSKPGSTDVWSVPANGSGTPAKIIPAAWSPALIRPSTD